MATIELEFGVRFRVPTNKKGRALAKRAARVRDALLSLAGPDIDEKVEGDECHMADVLDAMEHLASTVRRMRACNRSE